MKYKETSILKYRNAIPVMLVYQLISKLIMAGVLIIYKWFTGFLLWNMGRPAFTSGDLPYILRSWQGWLLICFGFIALIIYIVFDVNAMIIISDKVIHNEKIHVLSLIKEAAKRARNFKSVPGILSILYVSLIAPLTGIGLGISLTSGLVVPDFIMSFVNTKLILKILYWLLILVLAIVGFFNLFTFHFAILGNLDARTAMKRSRQIIKANWKTFIKDYLIFLIKSLILLALLILVTFVIPEAILNLLKSHTYLYHTGIIFITVFSLCVVVIYQLLFLYFHLLKMNLKYELYTGSDIQKYEKPDKVPYKKALITFAIICLLVMAGSSLFMGANFDTFFPKETNIEVISHRAGGDLNNENTILGLESAIEIGAKYAEIDVQRTKDNHYIINHDNTFQRCCNDPRTPQEMTLKEIKQLQVINSQDPFAPTTDVATIEEFLDSAKDRIPLFIELKGSSANEQMVEDLYEMVSSRNMTDQVVFISLNYNILETTKTLHPDIKTGYLCFFGFGDIQNMNCDILLLETETATEDNISKIHAANKKVGVWTINSLTSMVEFVGCSNADYIITDKVAEAIFMKEQMKDRPDVIRVLQKILPRL